MKKIYIVLAHTGTLLSRIIKMKTGAEYTHVSISLDEDLKRMYSFGRKCSYIAFWGGFVKEGADFGTFKRFYNTEISIYEVEISDESYNTICERIEYIKAHKNEYKFNILGLFLAGFEKKRILDKTYYCAEFVKAIMEKSNIDITGLPEIIKPEHFKNLNNSKLIYKGKLKEYKRTNRYMDFLLEYMLREKNAI